MMRFVKHVYIVVRDVLRKVASRRMWCAVYYCWQMIVNKNLGIPSISRLEIL